MKAIVQTRYGGPDVLELRDVPQPVPKDDEVRVRVLATSVNYGDAVARNFKAVSPARFNMPLMFWLAARLSFGVTRPRNPVLGNEFAGVVESVGRAVTLLEPGDEVFGYTGPAMGAYAEYLCIRESACVARKPTAMDFEEAATLPYGALMALSFLREARLEPGRKVLINGASGSIGSAAVQIARFHHGAEVTGVCGARGTHYVRTLGAHHVIDYGAADFTDGDGKYDLILDVLGRTPFARSRAVLTATGVHMYVSFKSSQLMQMLATSRRRPKVRCVIASPGKAELEAVRELVDAGRLTSIVGRRYPLARAADAHRAFEGERGDGAIGITVTP